jgi:hypothetical protein
MGYSSFHETSNICPEIVGKGAPKPPGGAALQGELRDAPIPDTARQRQLAAQDSPESRVRLPDGSQRHPRLQREGLGCAIAGSSAPKRVHAAFDANSVERLRGMLHRSPREFGYESSLWTLQMAAEAAFEEGLTEKRVSGETIRATLSRVLGIRWPSAEAESMAELHRAQMGSHGKRKVVEFDGLLGAYELADRVCRAFGCPHHEHLTIPQEVA